MAPQLKKLLWPQCFDAYDGDVLVLPDYNHEQVLLQFSEAINHLLA